MEFLKAQFTKIPHITPIKLLNSVVLITGANAGLGFETAREVLKFEPRRLILAVRSIERGKAAKITLESSKAPNTQIEIQELDQGSFDSVQAFAKRLEGQRIDIAILNAGVFSPKWTSTSDGYESDLQVNTLSPALLSLLLLPNLRLAASSSQPSAVKPHLTIVSSGLHKMAKFKESEQPEGQILNTLNEKTKYNQQDRYPVSKTVGLLWTKELAKRIPCSDIVINAPTPGFCKTGLMGNTAGGMKYVLTLFAALFGRSAEDGARCIIDAALIKGPETHGRYLSETIVQDESPLIRSSTGGSQIRYSLVIPDSGLAYSVLKYKENFQRVHMY
jgi:retinol dehydrogenase 12